MNMLLRDVFHRHFALVSVGCLVAGIGIGKPVGSLAPVVPWIMALFMFGSGLSLRLQDMSGLRKRPWVLPLALIIFHAGIPAAWTGIGVLLGYPLDAVMGFAILGMLPVSPSCIVWIGLGKGNITLGMSLLLADTLFSPFIIPYVLEILFGAAVHINPYSMLRGLFWMLFLPTLLALICNRVTNGNLHRMTESAFKLVGKAAIMTILFVNGGVVSPYVMDFSPTILLVILATLALSALMFLVTFLIGGILFRDPADVRAFMLTSVRSTTTGMVIAMAFFPPLTTLTVAFNMLCQQPFGAWAGKLALLYHEKNVSKQH